MNACVCVCVGSCWLIVRCIGVRMCMCVRLGGCLVVRFLLYIRASASGKCRASTLGCSFVLVCVS